MSCAVQSFPGSFRWNQRFLGVAHEATFLMQEARSELSQNEASPVQCPLRNQRENRYVNINPQNTETL